MLNLIGLCRLCFLVNAVIMEKGFLVSRGMGSNHKKKQELSGVNVTPTYSNLNISIKENECTLSDIPAKHLNSPTDSYTTVDVRTVSSSLDGTNGKQTNERPDVESSSVAND
ncbi:hypothetical protein Tco_1105342 [Tanacetum coccineum]